MFTRGKAFASSTCSVVLLVAGIAGCTGSPPAEPQVGRFAVVGAGISTDQGVYSSGDDVLVTTSAMPGNPLDWVAISPAGSDPNVYDAWTYTHGDIANTYSLSTVGLPDGNYVARAYLDNGYTILAERPFSIGTFTGIESNSLSYNVGDPVTITFGGLPATSTDWIAIALPGSDVHAYVQWKYTGGSTGGQVEFDALPAGDYVARAFPNDGFSLLYESEQFTIVGAAGSPTITGAGPYDASTPVTVSYSGFPGSGTDWIGLYALGAPANGFIAWQYVSGDSGSVDFGLRPPGDYEIRGFSANSYTQIATSGTVTVTGVGTSPTMSIALDIAGTGVDVTYADFPDSTDWIGLQHEGDAPGTFLQYVYASGSGMVNFASLVPGSYIARAYSLNSYNVMVEALTPVVIGGGGGGPATVSAIGSTFASADPMSVSFTGFPGNNLDWIGIYAVGAADSAFISWVYTHGGSSGGPLSMTAPLAPGSYELRGYVNGSYTQVPATYAFTVGP